MLNKVMKMDEESQYWIDPRDNPGLLLAMMREFVSDSHDSFISFEGRLGKLNFDSVVHFLQIVAHTPYI